MGDASSRRARRRKRAEIAKRAPDFTVSINGTMMHHANGDPVKGGDLIVSETYTYVIDPKTGEVDPMLHRAE